MNSTLMNLELPVEYISAVRLISTFLFLEGTAKKAYLCFFFWNSHNPKLVERRITIRNITLVVIRFFTITQKCIKIIRRSHSFDSNPFISFSNGHGSRFYFIRWKEEEEGRGKRWEMFESVAYNSLVKTFLEGWRGALVEVIIKHWQDKNGHCITFFRLYFIFFLFIYCF